MRANKELRVSLLKPTQLSSLPVGCCAEGETKGRMVGRMGGKFSGWRGGGRSKEKVRESEEHFEGMDSVAALREKREGFFKKKKRKKNRRIKSKLRLSTSSWTRVLSAKMEKRPSPIIRCSRPNAQVSR